MAKFIVVSHPHSYDCYIEEFDTLGEALKYYKEYNQYSELILAQVLEVELEVKLSPDINED